MKFVCRNCNTSIILPEMRDHVVCACGWDMEPCGEESADTNLNRGFSDLEWFECRICKTSMKDPKIVDGCVCPQCRKGIMSKSRDADTVNHPAHYNTGSIEVIDAIEDWGLGFNLGNVIKYISCAGKKGDALEDLKKAAWYLDREIKRLEAK